MPWCVFLHSVFGLFAVRWLHKQTDFPRPNCSFKHLQWPPLPKGPSPCLAGKTIANLIQANPSAAASPASPTLSFLSPHPCPRRMNGYHCFLNTSYPLMLLNLHPCPSFLVSLEMFYAFFETPHKCISLKWSPFTLGRAACSLFLLMDREFYMPVFMYLTVFC